MFTLLCSPFAQFGIKGTMLFNIVVSLFSAAFCIKISTHFQLPQPWLSAILFLFAPVVYASSLSGLTEPLFALFLVAAVWLLLKRKYTLAALVLSFHPFVRSEGFVLLTVFQLYFLWERKWMPLVLTLTGTLVYSVVGSFYFHDLLWIISKSPYGFGENIYGKGDWHFFISRNEFIYGIPFFVLSVLAMLYGFYRLKERPNKELVMLVLLPFSIYFLLHSALWALGIQAGGMKRVMTGGMPLLAVLASYGFYLLEQALPKLRSYRTPLALLFGLASMIYPFKQFGFGFAYSTEEKVLLQVRNHLIQNGPVRTKFYYLHPSFTLINEIDPFNTDQCGEIWSLPMPDRAKGMKPGEVLIWDSHYAALEGRWKEEEVRHDPKLELRTEIKDKDYTILVMVRKDV